MKNAMLIGKFNEITKEISDCLSEFCHIQLCADSEDIVEGMLKLVEPDLVVISLVGARSVHRELFLLVSREAPDAPVIAIGSKANEADLSYEGILMNKRVHFLQRPIKLDELSGCAKELLHIEGDDGLKTILVVDDNPTMLRTVQTMLSQKYKVTFATSGTQAIAAVGRAKPDLILLDYDMPVCNGKMTLQMLRSEEETREIPVVFLTGISDPGYVQEVLALHPQGYLLKPPAEDKLFETLDKVFAEAAGTAKQ